MTQTKPNKGTLTRYRNAILKAKTVEERRKRIDTFRDAIDRGLPSFEEVMLAIISTMETDVPEVQVGCTFALQIAARKGYDLTPAIPRLVHALYFLHRDHAASVLIEDIRRNRSHAPLIKEAIRTEGRRESNPDLERVLVACSSDIPPKEWRWGKCGVHTMDGCLTWFNEKTGFNWHRQDFAHFRKHGPWAPSSIMKEHEVPEEVWQELHRVFGIPVHKRRTKANIEAAVDSAIASLAAEIKELPPGQCQTCGSIPKKSWANADSGESLGYKLGPLRLALEFNQGGESFYQCPNCGRLFEYEHEVDNEPGASSDTESLLERTLEEIETRLRQVARDFEWTWTIPKKKN